MLFLTIRLLELLPDLHWLIASCLMDLSFPRLQHTFPLVMEDLQWDVLYARFAYV
jgi:hypothetical protein